MGAAQKVLEVIIRAKDDTKKAVKSAEGNLAGIGGGLAMGGAAVGAAALGATIAVAGAFDHAGNMAADYGKQVVAVQRMTGASADESSRFAAMLNRMGIDGTSLGRVFKSLDTQIVATGTKTKPALEQMGIAQKDANGHFRSSIDVLRDVAEYYSKSSNKTEALALASKVLGKGYQSLMPILAGGKKGFDDIMASADKFGLTLTQGNIDSIKKYNGAMKDNEQAAKGLELQFGLVAIPIKTVLMQWLGKLLAWFHTAQPAIIGFFRNAFGTAWSIIKPVVDAITHGFGGALKQVGGFKGAMKLIGDGVKAVLPFIKQMVKVDLAELWFAFRVGSNVVKWFWGVISDVFNRMKPTFAWLWQTVKTSLLPAWKDLTKAWNDSVAALKPLMPYLTPIATIIGIAIVGAIVLVIVVIAKFIQYTAWLAAKFSEVTKAFWDFVTGVKGGASELADALTKPFQDIGALLQTLNPFVRHSPSLIDNVLAGVGVIRSAYTGLSGMNLAGPTIGGIAAGSYAFAGSTGLSASRTGVPDSHIHVYLDGKELNRAQGKHVVSTSRSGAR